MKSAVLFAFCILAVNPPVKPDRNGKQTNPGPDLKAEPTIVVVNNQATSPVAANNAQEAPKWYATIDWANWTLAVIAGLTGLAIWQQAKETAKATKAMQDALPLQKASADAALLNARAVINSERPWVVIYAIKYKDGTASFRAGNTGRTPAEVVSYSSESRCVQHIKELPSEPEFTTTQVPPIKLLVPGENATDAAIDLLSSEDFSRCIDGCRGESGKTDLGNPPKMAVFYFRVLYTFPSGQAVPEAPPYESRACFCYSPAWDRPMSTCGNESYNRYT